MKKEQFGLGGARSRLCQSGARMWLESKLKPPEDFSYGRSYTARDPDGHPWFFTTPSAERSVHSDSWRNPRTRIVVAANLRAARSAVAAIHLATPAQACKSPPRSTKLCAVVPVSRKSGTR